MAGRVKVVPVIRAKVALVAPVKVIVRERVAVLVTDAPVVALPARVDRVEADRVVAMLISIRWLV